MSEEEKLQLENECLLKYSKAQMIQKYIDELEENCILSDLWCKSQEKIKEVREYIETLRNYRFNVDLGENREQLEIVGSTENFVKDILEILDKVGSD